MYTLYAENIRGAASKLPEQLQKDIEPLVQALTQMLGRCDASLVQRGDVRVEGDPTITLGPNVTVQVKNTDGTFTEVNLDPTALTSGASWLWAEWDGVTSPSAEDSNADLYDDHYRGFNVRMWGGDDPGSSPNIYDIGMLQQTTAPSPIYTTAARIFAVKGYDGRYYVVNGD